MIRSSARARRSRFFFFFVSFGAYGDDDDDAYKIVSRPGRFRVLRIVDETPQRPRGGNARGPTFRLQETINWANSTNETIICFSLYRSFYYIVFFFFSRRSAAARTAKQDDIILWFGPRDRSHRGNERVIFWPYCILIIVKKNIKSKNIVLNTRRPRYSLETFSS